MNNIIPLSSGWSLSCVSTGKGSSDGSGEGSGEGPDEEVANESPNKVSDGVLETSDEIRCEKYDDVVDVLSSEISDKSSNKAVNKNSIKFDQSTVVPFNIPGDVHSALLASGIIDEPYYRDNEYAVDWVNKRAWQLARTVSVAPELMNPHSVLVLKGIDCIASVSVNDIIVGSVDNQFVRHVLPVGEALVAGENIIKIVFDVAVDVAAARHASHPFELPGESLNSRIPNNNFLRKTPCHSGWDWNICLMPTGVYGSIQLQSPERCRIDDVRVSRQFDGEDVTLGVNVQLDVYEACCVPCTISIAGAERVLECELYPGQQGVDISLPLQSPALWWPAGMGEQFLHDLTITIDAEQWSQRIGLCQTQIVCQADEVGPGRGFRINVNEHDVFMRGANWIPPDALPERGTVDTVRELLQSAVDANMNMLRVWGGGQYEEDWFYDLCDELGILVWHDFMFSCNHYPATDAKWLASVRLEATQQVRRLSRYACLALWCGDNELVGALKWWEITQDNRDRYLANYVRLNTLLEEVVAAEAPDTPWWPSSPSQGLLDYADGWKSDLAGDMHFWDVWHEAKPFASYQDIRPRFCSEFGFQSFPSMPMIDSFTEAADQNVSSRVMGVHQRNVGGNARIVETLVRYFAFPDTFERTVFLSQCQQTMAIRTAVEYWRSLKPHCMGTLYWQLNDTWPVASWSSLEYGGAWKLLHYAARRFYQDVMMMIVPVDRPERGARDFMGVEAAEDARLMLRAVNDTAHVVKLRYEVQAIDMHGAEIVRWEGTVELSPQAAEDVLPIAGVDVPDGCFLSFNWRSDSVAGSDEPEAGSAAAGAASAVGANAVGVDAEVSRPSNSPMVIVASRTRSPASGQGEYWTRPYKHFDLPEPVITVVEEPDCDGISITLQTDKPAFFVTVELGGRRVWSDNGFTLLPGQAKTLHVVRELSHQAVPDLEKYVIEHL